LFLAHRNTFGLSDGAILALGPLGVFLSIAIAESILALMGIYFFKKGRWRTMKV
jgi:Na+-driven multidrug efflux pump